MGSALAFQIAYLLPVLRTGWLYDDAYHYTLRPEAEANGQSFWAYAVDSLQSFMSAGRFFPLWFFQGLGVFYVVTDVLVYKALLLVLTSIASAAVWFLLRRLGMAAAPAAAVVVAATAFMQLRTYHDPILGFAGVMQFLVLEISVALILFLGWLAGRGRGWLVGSIAVFAVACLWYELAYAMSLLFVALALVSKHRAARSRLLGAAPFVTVAGVFGAVAVFLRRRAEAVFPGYEPSLEPGVVLETFANQVGGALPGAYALSPGNADLRDPDLFVRAVSPSALLLAAAATVLVLGFLHLRRAPDGRSLDWRSVVVIGAGFALLPAVPIAVAGKYQRELTAGVAYIPVFMEVFGIAMLLVLATELLRSSASRRRTGGFGTLAVAAVLALFVGAAAGYDRVLNNRTVDESVRLKALQEADERQFRRGLIAQTAEGSRFYVDRPWLMSPGFFARFGDRRVEVRHVADALFTVDQVRAEPCEPGVPSVYQVLAEPTLPEVVADRSLPPTSDLELVCFGPVVDRPPQGIRGF